MNNAIFWMAGSISFFCLMATGARELSHELPIMLSLFFRSLIGVIVVGTLLLATGQRQQFFTKRPTAHAVRNLFHLAGQYGWFMGIGLLPLAQVIALEFTVPIWTTVIAALTLGERITTRKLIAVLMGICGVWVIVQPDAGSFDSASLIVLAAAVGYAISHIGTKTLSATDSSVTIVFYMCLIQMPLAFLLALPNWQWPVGAQWFWLGVIGVSALLAHYCLTNAMRGSDVARIMTMDYLRLPAMALVGVLFYSEQLAWTLLAGGVLMVIGNLVNNPQVRFSTILSKE
ncbi:DMT family transporter [Parathalassolituus penaei]|uniref:DMT family transporter n=1 Tax=Parathalassolituus penaei TaxID=2997323 RepID=A0A9X3EF95_9GAMM|nr:DMT family transporter [Parathalassolituus penaei]MCY0966528.1 DMT family transporter [Parathalassolituus penaei]